MRIKPHNNHFDYDDNALICGMAVLAQTFLDLSKEIRPEENPGEI
ncbi:hypothetical protein [Dethiosulfatarculus sandiegensis]|uniref:Uncharacterized protein n=1 Tax=Dethiosulfatarculus sandiegensis TaxID=1429043 RepID=A0A0D2J8F2_9BACT|nr:hypothetical protein [Dethiosulfatarculus sandiegensis]KIX14449.1 hypothetical protein X474_10075 [Dethiosulfatarculus sandiegensis]